MFLFYIIIRTINSIIINSSIIFFIIIIIGIFNSSINNSSIISFIIIKIKIINLDIIISSIIYFIILNLFIFNLTIALLFVLNWRVFEGDRQTYTPKDAGGPTLYNRQTCRVNCPQKTAGANILKNVIIGNME